MKRRRKIRASSQANEQVKHGLAKKCRDGVYDLPVNIIHGDPQQPRKEFDPEALKELAESLKSAGQIHPIKVRPHASQAGHWMVVVGERRLRAAKLAGLEYLRAEICDYTDEEAARVQLAENEARRQPSESETARFVAARILAGDTLEQIASAAGRGVNWVVARREIAKLSTPLQAEVDGGRMPIGVAAALGELPQNLQRHVWDAARSHSSSATAQEAYVRNVLLKQAGKDLFGQEVVEFVNGLSPAQRKKLREKVERLISNAARLAAARPEEVSAYAQVGMRNSEAIVADLRQIARSIGRIADHVEAVRAARAAGELPANQLSLLKAA